MKNKYYHLFCIVVIIGIILIAGCVQKEQKDITPTKNVFSEIAQKEQEGITPTEKVFSEIEECIVGVQVDYNSEIVVNNDEDVELVFNKYIAWAKENNEGIFGYENNWKFENSTIHGLYEEIKYWKVTASWFSEEDQKWRIKTVFDVSENGEVVRLLGCI